MICCNDVVQVLRPAVSSVSGQLTVKLKPIDCFWVEGKFICCDRCRRPVPHGDRPPAIRDACMLVNFYGAAFRTARIMDSYLESRLMQLRLAVAVQEIELREKEERRQIKEQIWEEERAQREFQR